MSTFLYPHLLSEDRNSYTLPLITELFLQLALERCELPKLLFFYNEISNVYYVEKIKFSIHYTAQVKISSADILMNERHTLNLYNSTLKYLEICDAPFYPPVVSTTWTRYQLKRN